MHLLYCFVSLPLTLQGALDCFQVDEIIAYAASDGLNADIICFRALNVAPKGNNPKGGDNSIRAASELQLMLRFFARTCNVPMRELWIMFAKMGTRICVVCQNPKRAVSVGGLVCCSGACAAKASTDMGDVLKHMTFKEFTT